MERFLGGFSNHAYAIMRIVVGFVFLLHGAQKLFGAFPRNPDEAGSAAALMSLMGVAGVLEFFGGLLVMVGFRAGWAAFLVSGQMAVAYFMVHFPQGVMPVQNMGGETAILYSFVFLYIATRGSGMWSVDAMLSGEKSASRAAATA